MGCSFAASPYTGDFPWAIARLTAQRSHSHTATSGLQRPRLQSSPSFQRFRWAPENLGRHGQRWCDEAGEAVWLTIGGTAEEARVNLLDLQTRGGAEKRFCFCTSDHVDFVLVYRDFFYRTGDLGEIIVCYCEVRKEYPRVFLVAFFKWWNFQSHVIVLIKYHN